MRAHIYRRNPVLTELSRRRAMYSRRRALTRVSLEYSAESAPLGGGGIMPLPLPNSRKSGRSEAGEAAIESSQRLFIDFFS